MILRTPQKCFNFYSHIYWMQASHVVKQLGSLNYSKVCAIPPNNGGCTSSSLLQACSRGSTLSGSKRHMSQKFKKPGRFGGGGKSAHIYAKKFLAGGMIDPKLPWMPVTGQPKVKQIVKNQGGNTTAHRLKVLDQAFFTAITDQIASGQLGDKLGGRGLVITKVRVQNGLVGMQVFWTQTHGDLSFLNPVSKNQQQPHKPVQGEQKEEQESIEDLLAWAAPILRQEIADLRVVGCTVPHINFRQDVSILNSLEVERILVKVRDEMEEAEERSEEAAKRERELLLEQQRRLQVPESIFAPDFVYQPVYYDATDLPKYSGKKPLSCFTPFAPLGKGLRVAPKTSAIDSAELIDNATEDPMTGFATSAEDKPASPSSKGVLRLRQSVPQHGIMLQNNVYGINRDKIMKKIAESIGRMKEYTSVTNADINFPFALTLRLPSGEPEPSNEQPDVEHFTSKSSLKSWAYRYSRKTSRDISEEKKIIMKAVKMQAEEKLMEREAMKYDEFEEDLQRHGDEQDYWIEPEDKY